MTIGDNDRPVAAITGASSGFGKIYAKRLASEGAIFSLLRVVRINYLRRQMISDKNTTPKLKHWRRISQFWKTSFVWKNAWKPFLPYDT